MAQVSNPGGGKIFCTCLALPWDQPSLLYNGYRVPFPRVRRPGMVLTTHPHLSPRLKKEQSYTTTLIWAFMACSSVNLHINTFHTLGAQCMFKTPTFCDHSILIPLLRLSSLLLKNQDATKLLRSCFPLSEDHCFNAL
jgi:hypothetical protein